MLRIYLMVVVSNIVLVSTQDYDDLYESEVQRNLELQNTDDDTMDIEYMNNLGHTTEEITETKYSDGKNPRNTIVNPKIEHDVANKDDISEAIRYSERQRYTEELLNDRYEPITERSRFVPETQPEVGLGNKDQPKKIKPIPEKNIGKNNNKQKKKGGQRNANKIGDLKKISSVPKKQKSKNRDGSKLNKERDYFESKRTESTITGHPIVRAIPEGDNFYKDLNLRHIQSKSRDSPRKANHSKNRKRPQKKHEGDLKKLNPRPKNKNANQKLIIQLAKNKEYSELRRSEPSLPRVPTNAVINRNNNYNIALESKFTQTESSENPRNTQNTNDTEFLQNTDAVEIPNNNLRPNNKNSHQNIGLEFDDDNDYLETRTESSVTADSTDGAMIKNGEYNMDEESKFIQSESRAGQRKSQNTTNTENLPNTDAVCIPNIISQADQKNSHQKIGLEFDKDKDYLEFRRSESSETADSTDRAMINSNKYNKDEESRYTQSVSRESQRKSQKIKNTDAAHISNIISTPNQKNSHQKIGLQFDKNKGYFEFRRTESSVTADATERPMINNHKYDMQQESRFIQSESRASQRKSQNRVNTENLPKTDAACIPNIISKANQENTHQKIGLQFDKDKDYFEFKRTKSSVTEDATKKAMINIDKYVMQKESRFIQSESRASQRKSQSRVNTENLPKTDAACIPNIISKANQENSHQKIGLQFDKDKDYFKFKGTESSVTADSTDGAMVNSDKYNMDEELRYAQSKSSENPRKTPNTKTREDTKNLDLRNFDLMSKNRNSNKKIELNLNKFKHNSKLRGTESSKSAGPTENALRSDNVNLNLKHIQSDFKSHDHHEHVGLDSESDLRNTHSTNTRGETNLKFRRKKPKHRTRLGYESHSEYRQEDTTRHTQLKSDDSEHRLEDFKLTTIKQAPQEAFRKTNAFLQNVFLKNHGEKSEVELQKTDFIIKNNHEAALTDTAFKKPSYNHKFGPIRIPAQQDYRFGELNSTGINVGIRKTNQNLTDDFNDMETKEPITINPKHWKSDLDTQDLERRKSHSHSQYTGSGHRTTNSHIQHTDFESRDANIYMADSNVKNTNEEDSNYNKGEKGFLPIKKQDYYRHPIIISQNKPKSNNSHPIMRPQNKPKSNNSLLQTLFKLSDNKNEPLQVRNKPPSSAEDEFTLNLEDEIILNRVKEIIEKSKKQNLLKSGKDESDRSRDTTGKSEIHVEMDAAKTCGYDSCPETHMNQLNVHIVAHTHNDLGWLKTIDEYYYGSQNKLHLAGVQYILDSVVNELWKDPSRKFIYVETAYFWRWWQHQSTGIQEKVRALVQQGRLQFASGGWSMNDEATTHYQSIIDQFTYGLKKLYDTFGPCGMPRTGWQIDPFGHSREFASLLAAMGYDGLFLGRIDYEDKHHRKYDKRMEMIWQGDDDLGNNSDIFTSILDNVYSAPSGFCFDILCQEEPIIDEETSPLYNVEAKVNKFLDHVREMSRQYQTKNVLVTMGGDFMYQDAGRWYRNIDKLIKNINNRNEEHYPVNVRLMYSTPECYLKAVKKFDPLLPVKLDDFFPYAAKASAYYTGYFTSRPTLKYLEREGNGYLQVVKQLQLVTGLDDRNMKIIDELKSAMGLMQHHEAITGTSKQHVANDYVRILNTAIENSLNVARLGFNKLQGGSDNPLYMLSFDRCRLNESQCAVSENSAHFVVTLYNPLGWPVHLFPVRIPVQKLEFKVFQASGESIEFQLIEIPNELKQIPSRHSNATHEIVFLARDLPPIGMKNYYVTNTKLEKDRTDQKRLDGIRSPINRRRHQRGKRHMNLSNKKYLAFLEKLLQQANAGTEKVDLIKNENVTETAKLLEEAEEKKPQSLTNFKTRLVLDQEGKLVSIYNGNNYLCDFRLEIAYYPSYIEDQRFKDKQTSGAYIFRPQNDIVTVPLITKKIIKGSAVEELHYTAEELSSGIIRLYKHPDLNYIEHEWLVGPIKTDDGTGKEVIIRYLTNVSNKGVFYTDSNGRQMIKRTVDRTLWNNVTVAMIAKNYYPVTNRIYIEEGENRLTVLTDRPEGGTSLKDGEIELMVHRRLVFDDGVGVEEPLEEKDHGRGIIVRGKHRILYEKATKRNKENRVKEKISSVEFHLQPKVFISNADHIDLSQWEFLHNSIGVVNNSLPTGLHLLTLEPWGPSQLMLRIENLLETTDLAYTTIAIDIMEIFSNIELKNIKEMKLGANRGKDDKRMNWRADRDNYEKENHEDKDKNNEYTENYEYTKNPVKDKSYIVKIKAKEIRTFIADYKINPYY